MSLKIQQGSIFGKTESSAASQPRNNSPSSQNTYKAGPNLTLVAGLDKATLQNDSVYLLRSLARQYVRGLPAQQAKKKFIKTLMAEIKLKQGQQEADMLLKTCLLERHIEEK